MAVPMVIAMAVPEVVVEVARAKVVVGVARAVNAAVAEAQLIADAVPRILCTPWSGVELGNLSAEAPIVSKNLLLEVFLKETNY